MDELGSNILHNFHVVGEGGCRRTGVAAGRQAGAKCVEVGAFERGDEGCPGLGKEVAAVDDQDGGFGEGHDYLRLKSRIAQCNGCWGLV